MALFSRRTGSSAAPRTSSGGTAASARSGSSAAPRPAEETVEGARSTSPGQPVRKDRPTPTRREAEAARMKRLHPELDPKAAKRIDRESRAADRERVMVRYESQPERQLLRDVVDSRFNLGEIVLPLMLVLVMVSVLPGFVAYASWILLAMYGVLGLMAVDTFLMWRTFKRLHRERTPQRPLRGLLMTGMNRQMTFRRWRQPAPRVSRGEAI